MSFEKELQARSGGKCELCGADHGLSVYVVPPAEQNNADYSALLCEICLGQIENSDTTDANHWRCLNDSMWSEVSAIKVLAWRMLSRLKKEGWPQDLLDMLYLDEDLLKWAQATGEGVDLDDADIHKDSNGARLMPGDTVTLIKDLNVKGSSMIAKRGTAVRNISLVHDNPSQIEGRVNGQQIVILTEFVKKS